MFLHANRAFSTARVDSQVPVYEFSIEEVWKDWTWTEKYPGWKELREYFKHVENVLDIKKDVSFSTNVKTATFDQNDSMWTIRTENMRTIRAKYFILATGFAAKRHFPDWKGLDTFKGTVHHSSFWPSEGVDVKGKRVAVIGTGSTGVQIAQECGPDAAELTVFQRTPNLALPMQQGKLTKEEQDKAKSDYPKFFEDRLKTFNGFDFEYVDKYTLDQTPEEREEFFERLWQEGGFKLWLGSYKDLFFDDKANDEVYNFWVKKTRARIHDPVKRDILAPLKKPHAFGTKRPSLEQNYFDQFNKPNMMVVDIRANPVQEVVPEGIITADGKLHEIDIIALATGFDAVTGGLKQIGIKSIDGELLADKWKEGTWSYLGMTLSGFPNLFFLYGPHGPTAFANGPTCVELQGGWIIDVINDMEKKGVRMINPSKEAEDQWKKDIDDLWDKNLCKNTESWYSGANIPGKPKESLNYTGGMQKYEKECRREMANDYAGFVLSY